MATFKNQSKLGRLSSGTCFLSTMVSNNSLLVGLGLLDCFRIVSIWFWFYEALLKNQRQRRRGCYSLATVWLEWDSFCSCFRNSRLAHPAVWNIQSSDTSNDHRLEVPPMIQTVHVTGSLEPTQGSFQIPWFWTTIPVWKWEHFLLVASGNSQKYLKWQRHHGSSHHRGMFFANLESWNKSTNNNWCVHFLSRRHIQILIPHIWILMYVHSNKTTMKLPKPCNSG